MSETSHTALLVLSPQQAAFVQWVREGSGSCVLEAVAGAGKTFSILQGVQATPVQSAYVVYNKKNASEAEAKLQKMGIDWKRCKAGTAHSFGLAAFRKSFGNPKIESYKVADLVDAAAELPVSHAYKPVIVKLVSMAKQRALGIVRPLDDVAAWMEIVDHYDVLDDVEGELESETIYELVQAAIKILRANNEQTDKIDFDDMVYLPVLLNCRFWQYRLIFLDEAQDTNPGRRALVRAMLAPGGRLVAVGDPCQAIYGFTGADNDALDQIAADFSAIHLPLTVSYRCPRALIAFARQWVSHIEAHENAAEGTVGWEAWGDFVKRNDLNGDSAILCRNTKPLVKAAFALIRRKVACRIEGRDIGTQLVKLITRWSTIKTVNALEAKLIDYCTREKDRALSKRNESRAQMIEDQVETILVIIDECRKRKQTTILDVVNFVNELFADNVAGMLTLSTIHKSKGREWRRVFWLNREATCPSKYARQQWQQDQERNLMYVAATRSLDQLIDLVRPDRPGTGDGEQDDC